MMEPILKLASKLPSGLKDPKAKAKLEGELVEFDEAFKSGDALDAFAEASDVFYYAKKALHNGLISKAYAEEAIAYVARALGVSAKVVERAAIAKYELRARPGNPKDFEAEREAIRKAIK